MNDTVTGLILSQADYRDHDVMLRVMTKEYGLIGFIAAGARKMTSKNAGSILPLTKAEIHFDYKDGKSLFRLKTARTREFFRKIHEDLVLSAAASVLADACMHMCQDNPAGAPEEYELLETALTQLNDGHPHTLVLSLYLSDMMKLFGIAADVDECVRCGATTIRALSAKEGGFLCTDCASSLGIPFSEVSELKRFRLIVKGGLKHTEIIEKASASFERDLETLVEMLRLHAGIELRSFAFYKRFCH